jgi:adenylosuccinate synthase
MPNLCVVGLQWGDEGKGKVVDLLSERFDVIVRFQGGANAGHTVVRQGQKFVFHFIPCGILRPEKTCVIANGVVLDPESLFKEVDEMTSRGIKISDNLKISDRAHVLFPYHKVIDKLMDAGKGGPRIGTTGRGIGPCYTDKMARVGIRVAELLDARSFRDRLKATVEEKNRIIQLLYKGEPLDWKQIYEVFSNYAERLRPFVCDTTEYLEKAMDGGKSVMFEGAQGTLLDVDFGTYPFVTSSNTSAAGVAAGTGISPKKIGHTVGIMKAYTTRVGEGPFPTQAEGGSDERLRQRGGEFGATTGRPRRCGWFDAVSVGHSVRVNGVDSIFLTKLDVLSGEDSIRVCRAYKYNGSVTGHFPAAIAAMAAAEPVYDEFAGWSDAIQQTRRVEDLPATAQKYIGILEKSVGAPIGAVSVGEDRDATIFKPDWLKLIK